MATRLTGYGGYGPGKVDQHRERGLSIAEWQRIESVANAAGFDPLESSKGPGVDGADFILERAFNGNHRLVWRWSPEDAAFMSVCDALLDLGARDLVIETEPKLDRPSSNRKSDGG